MLHHVELYVRDVERSRAFWTPFMTLLGHAEDRWAHGVNYRLSARDPYVSLVQAPVEHREAGYHRQRVGAAAVAKATGEAGRHIRERGFEKQYYLDLIQALVREHEPATRDEINHAVIPKLPDRLTQQQKVRKVHNLMQELRRAGRIENRGSRGQPAWFFTGESAGG